MEHRASTGSMLDSSNWALLPCRNTVETFCVPIIIFKGATLYTCHGDFTDCWSKLSENNFLIIKLVVGNLTNALEQLEKFSLNFSNCNPFPSLSSVAVHTRGAFFWDYSGMGFLGIDGICVLLGAIPFSE